MKETPRATQGDITLLPLNSWANFLPINDTTKTPPKNETHILLPSCFHLPLGPPCLSGSFPLFTPQRAPPNFWQVLKNMKQKKKENSPYPWPSCFGLCDLSWGRLMKTHRIYPNPHQSPSSAPWKPDKFSLVNSDTSLRTPHTRASSMPITG